MCNMAEHEIPLVPNAKPVYQSLGSGTYNEEHRQRLVMGLSALRKANLKLKLAKCRFGEKEITALGHRISAEGVRLNLAKVKAVKEFPPLPTSGKRADLDKWVKSFLGLLSYYRRFFPGFAEVAKPLMDLTKDKTLFIWRASLSFSKP